MERDYNPCLVYSASIIAVNPVGNGSVARISFPGIYVDTCVHILPPGVGRGVLSTEKINVSLVCVYTETF